MAANRTPLNSLSVKPSDCIPNYKGRAENAAAYSDDSIAELAKQIKRDGQLVPVRLVTAGKENPGKYNVVDGTRRILAMTMLEKGHRGKEIKGDDQVRVRAEIEEHTPNNGETGLLRFARTLSANRDRENPNPMDDARALQVLKTEFKLNGKEAAKHIGVTPGYVSNTLEKLLKLEPAIQRQVASGEIPAQTACTLLDLKPEARNAVAEAARNAYKEVINRSAPSYNRQFEALGEKQRKAKERKQEQEQRAAAKKAAQEAAKKEAAKQGATNKSKRPRKAAANSPTEKWAELFASESAHPAIKVLARRVLDFYNSGKPWGDVIQAINALLMTTPPNKAPAAPKGASRSVPVASVA